MSDIKPQKRGLFVTLEGPEGAGKTTLIQSLLARAAAIDWPTLQTREPGGTEGAEAIRALLVQGDAGRWSPLSEVLLFFAARQDHLARKIRPALADGQLVLCDRFSDSTRAYQGAGGGVSAANINMLDQLVVGDDQPDLTFIVDIDVEIGLARAAKRGGKEMRFEGKDLSYHYALRAAYLDLAKSFPHRCVVLNGQDSPESLVAQAWAEIVARHGR